MLFASAPRNKQGEDWEEDNWLGRSGAASAWLAGVLFFFFFFKITGVGRGGVDGHVRRRLNNFSIFADATTARNKLPGRNAERKPFSQSIRHTNGISFFFGEWGNRRMCKIPPPHIQSSFKDRASLGRKSFPSPTSSKTFPPFSGVEVLNQ